MINNERIDAALLSELLSYDANTGTLTWKLRNTEHFKHLGDRSDAICKMWNRKFAGKPAFTASDSRGYRRGNILNRTFEAHRVCFAIYHGAWPDLQIDHINGNPSDNSISNLRQATTTQQARNAAMPSTNTSGTVGVSWDKSRKKWAAFIHLENRITHLGRYTNFGDAVAARKNAERIHGFHPNHGRIAA